MISDPYILRREVERVVGEDRVPIHELERLLAEYGDVGPEIGSRRPLLGRVAGILVGALRRARQAAARPSGDHLMARFAVAVVVEAKDAEEARRFLSNMLWEEVRWDRPLPIPYIGESCPIAAARRYRTEEIHLLRDGMRAIAVPDRSS